MMGVNDSKLISKKEIEILLRHATECSGIRLPRDIEFFSQNGILNIYVCNPIQNMQTNGAAFEGWIVALKTWLPYIARRVELDFSLPADFEAKGFGNPETCHYNRFLYRLNNFLRLFPEWFSIGDGNVSKAEEFMRRLKQGPYLVNHSLRERKSVIETEKKERQIESWLTFEGGKEHLCKLWDLSHEKLFNQLPIGVFYKEIERKNAIFTRGAGAIDLWGIGRDGTTLHIIELKCGNNISMGVISETLFYTAVIYDTCVAQNNLFRFGKYKNSHETEDMMAIQNGGHKFKQLHSHVLAESYHPLFSDSVVNLLSEGLSRLDIKFDRAKYDYNNKKLPA